MRGYDETGDGRTWSLSGLGRKTRDSTTYPDNVTIKSEILCYLVTSTIENKDLIVIRCVIIGQSEKVRDQTRHPIIKIYRSNRRKSQDSL